MPTTVTHNDPEVSIDLAMPMLKEAGVGSSNVRLKEYREFLAQCKDNVLDNSDRERNITLWREVNELAFILDVFRKNQEAMPAGLLKKALSGNVLNSNNPEKDRSRNYLLELRAAVYFLASGFRVQLEGASDLVVFDRRRKYFVECKRIYSKNKIKERIKEAATQAVIQLDGKSASRGDRAILWIDLSPILLRACPVYHTYSRDSARDAARRDLMTILKGNLNEKHNVVDKRIKALVAQVLWASNCQDGTRITTGFTTIVFPPSNRVGLLDMFFLRKLFDRVLKVDSPG